MINYVKGDILDITEGVIVQQVNCMGGRTCKTNKG